MHMCRDAIIKFNKQDRHSIVTLGAAKGLVRWAARCFTAFSMTMPVVVGKFHNRVPTNHMEKNAPAAQYIGIAESNEKNGLKQDEAL